MINRLKNKKLPKINLFFLLFRAVEHLPPNSIPRRHYLAQLTVYTIELLIKPTF